jgi:hypothetical protein
VERIAEQRLVQGRSAQRPDEEGIRVQASDRVELSRERRAGVYLTMERPQGANM